MPITAWLCPECNQTVPLDHYASSACGDKIPAAYANAVLANEEDTGPSARVSDGLSCPRKTAIMLQEKVAVNPLDFKAQVRGHAVHGLYEKHKQEGYIVEKRLSGIVAGINITGKPDVLIESKHMILDYKTCNDFNAKYLKEKPKADHVAQISAYADLCEQALGWRPKMGIIHYDHSFGFISHVVDLPSGSAYLDHQPAENGRYSMRSLLMAGLLVRTGNEKWSDMPLYGEEFKFGGKTGCDYCPVRKTCWEQARGAEF